MLQEVIIALQPEAGSLAPVTQANPKKLLSPTSTIKCFAVGPSTCSFSKHIALWDDSSHNEGK